MNKKIHTHGGGVAFLASSLSCLPFGPRIAFDADRGGGAPNVETLVKAFEQRDEKLAGDLAQIKEKLGDADARLLEMEQKGARRSGGADVPQTWGGQIALKSNELTPLDSKNGKVRLEVKDFVGSGPTSAGALVVPEVDRNIVMMPHRRLTIRSLLGAGRTSSSSVEFMRQTGFASAAATVAEGASKPQSNLTFEMQDAKVRVIAHFVKASRQILSDVPQLQSVIDGELRYGVAREEEDQLLLGSGTGQDLLGLVPQATDYQTSRNLVGDTRFDTLLHAVEQAETAELPASGIVLNTADWFAMLGIKDGDGRYISGGPLADVPDRIWRLPVVWTNAMAPGEFLVGAFQTAATVYDREQTTVELGYENDDFTRNLVTILAEERLALAVKRPEALIYGAFPTT